MKSAHSQDNAAWPVTTASYLVSSENTKVFTEDKMNAFAVTLFCTPDIHQVLPTLGRGIRNVYG